MKKLKLFLFCTLFLAVGASYAQSSPEGKWLRISEDKSWVIYSFEQDGSLERATNKAPISQSFGNYRIDDNVIFFENNPEGYTPVGFEIRTADCNGFNGSILVLSDLKTKVEYGCYVRLSASE